MPSEISPKEDVLSSKVCLIGAGSSGIVAAKLLREHGIAFDCFEKGSGIGGNWRFRNDNGMSASYSSLHINTSKERMAYSDFPMSEEYPDYPHHSQVLEYFERYVDHFEIRDKITFNTSVEKVRKAGAGWEVTVRGPEGKSRSEIYRAVLVANGHHWDPRLPSFPGRFSGEVLHAHAYETPQGFDGQRVLVVGIGNSGVDIACELSRVAAKTFLSTRQSAHILPKYAWGRPIDTFASPLGSMMPVKVQELFFRLVLAMTRGPQHTVGVPEPDHTLLQAHPTISAELLHLAGHGKLHMKPNIDRLDGKKVHFTDGSVEEIDRIIYATGYKITFPFFDDDLLGVEKNRVRLYRHVVHTEHEGLYFLGLVQPLGAVMPIAEQQSRWVANLLTGASTLPPKEEMERTIDADLAAMHKRYIKSARNTIQVDFFPYMRAVKKEIGRKA